MNISSPGIEPEQLLPEQYSFSEILPEGALLCRIAELGFTVPTDIQFQSVRKALSGQDLILKAKTGSGKTFAFVLPLLQRFSELGKHKDETVALFITPTRELALQIQEVIQSLEPELDPVLVIGGVDEKKQKKALEKDARIIVGTPGRLMDLIRKKIINLKTCRYFALDEADEMLSMGFIEDIRAILSRLPRERQGLFVSATISPRVEMLAQNFLNNPEYIQAEAGQEEAPSIEHLYCETGGELLSKALALCDIIETQNPASAIIFCNTRSETEFVELLLRRRGFDARRMNSDLSQSQRQKVISKIKSKELRLLVATDIAARGIDINQLDLVIHYSLHDQPETYVHRTGRTGRAGMKGRVISIIGPREYPAFHYIKKVLKTDFKMLELPTDGDVAGARLAHIYKKLRDSEEKLDTRAFLSAGKLLEDHGISGDGNEELQEIVGRLLEFTLSHSVAEEAKSLDEELMQSDKTESKMSADNSGQRESGRTNKEKRKRTESVKSKRQTSEARKSSGRKPVDERKTHKKRGSGAASRRRSDTRTKGNSE
jgi:ATP-dependent RNA helicase DeaD